MLAASLAALAGYVDAVGFLTLGGFFVSFMSGNSTRFAVGLAGDTGAAMTAGGLVATFVAGVVLGSVVADAAGRHRASVVLALVALLLALAGLASGRSGDRVAAFVLATAMGVENAVFARDGEVTIGLTYMTGTLVKLGQRLAVAVRGGDRWGWLSHLALWASLVGGAVVGAVAHGRIGSAAIWPAAGVAAMLALLASRLGALGLRADAG